MGNEAKCVARIEGKKDEGKALLETSELIFRGAQCRVKITFAEVRAVEAVEGELRIKTCDALYVFEIGVAAEKWREKILHPKSRAEKLGVKAGLSIRLVGSFDADFSKELKLSKALVAKGGKNGTASVTFFAAEASQKLALVRKLAKQLKNDDALWVVYPKGKKGITESDVLNAGRKAGLKDVKVVGFSARYTALKFVIPIDKR